MIDINATEQNSIYRQIKTNRFILYVLTIIINNIIILSRKQ